MKAQSCNFNRAEFKIPVLEASIKTIMIIVVVIKTNISLNHSVNTVSEDFKIHSVFDSHEVNHRLRISVIIAAIIIMIDESIFLIQLVVEREFYICTRKAQGKSKYSHRRKNLFHIRPPFFYFLLAFSNFIYHKLIFP